MNSLRSKNMTAKRAIFGALLASIMLSGCSNPYSVPEVDPNLEAPSVEEFTPPPPASAPNEDELVPEGEEPVDAVGEIDLSSQGQYFGLDTTKVHIPEAVSEKFGESAATIANDGLYAMWDANNYSQYQQRPLKPEEHQLLVLSMREHFSTRGEEMFAKDLADAPTDVKKYLAAFQIMPYLIDQKLELNATESYTVDSSKLWKAVYWNPQITNLIGGEGETDGASFGFNRSIYIPLEEGGSMRVDAYIELDLIPNADGKWVIDNWKFEQAPAELEK